MLKKFVDSVENYLAEENPMSLRLMALCINLT